MSLCNRMGKVCLTGLLLVLCFFYAHAYEMDIFADFVESDPETTQVPKVNIPGDDPIFRLDYLACSLDEDGLLGRKRNAKSSRALVDRMLNFLRRTPNQGFAIEVLMDYTTDDNELGKYIFAEMGKIALADERQYVLPIILGMNAEDKNDLETAMKFFHCAADRIFTNDDFVQKIFAGDEIEILDFSFLLGVGSKCAIQLHDTAFLKKVDKFLDAYKDSMPLGLVNSTLNAYADMIVEDEFHGNTSPVPSCSVGAELLRRLPKLVDCYFLALERMEPKDFEQDDLLNRRAIVALRLTGAYSLLPYYLQVLAMKYPGEGQILVALTDIYTDLHQYDEAYYTLKKYFAYFSHRASVKFYRHMAELCYSTERYAEGLEMYREAIKKARMENLDADVKQLAVEACADCFVSKNFHEALEFVELMPMDKFPPILLKICIFASNGKKEAASRVVEENIDLLLKDFPLKSKGSENDFNVLLTIACTGKNVVVNEKLYAFGMTHFKDKANYQNSLAYFYACNNIKLNEAEELAKNAVEVSNEKAAILDTLAWVYYRQGKFQLALETMRKCFAESAKEKRELSCVEYCHLGDIQFELKNYAEAEKNWLRALDLYEEEPADEFEKDDLLKRLQKVEKILEANKNKVKEK